MQNRPIYTRIEFYNFLSHYLATSKAFLSFAVKQLDYAESLSSTALHSVNLNKELDLVKEIRRREKV